MLTSLPRMMALLLLITGSTASKTGQRSITMDNNRCKVTCQRFGMKALGPKFATITAPQKCVSMCDEVYPEGSQKGHSMLQTRQDVVTMDNNKCKVMCQRFGMKSMGPKFATITMPQKCVSMCDEVYPEAGNKGHSLLAIRQNVSSMDNNKCKETCQRFGMKSMGPKFATITMPQKCVPMCDEVYPEVGNKGHSMLETRQDVVTMDNNKCKETCQRFGMKSMGPKFATITMPQKCVSMCDEVYPEAGNKGHSLLAIRQNVSSMDNNKCKVTCQRFGMKSLGPKFASITMPQKCVSMCDEVFPA